MTALPRAILLAAGALLFAACGSDTPERTLSGYQLDPAPNVASFSLPDASASDLDFPFVARDEHLLIVYFGYTACPDVCPTTLTEVRNALKQLGDPADKIDLAMVTIDPERDTAEILTGYLQSFVSNAHALRTDDADALQAAAHAFGASYSVTKTADGDVEVTHSGAMYVVDSNGTVVLTWPFGIRSDGIATDLEILLSESVQ
ncbi:MAG: SCO family protein [Actinomycetia bacterium]|nr:SCO family protein [Actinomycetes bacterium]